ncbi:hypothetical protein AgCh_016060 [Apium graveolens]
MASSIAYNSPCAACKFLRRKCMPSCIFAPYFPPEEPQKFANVHKIFGASNVTKLLNELLPHQREDAVNSLAYEAEARVRDPVYGCVGAISYLQRQVERLQKELDAANTDLIRFAWSDALPPLPQGISLLSPRQRPIDLIISTTRHNIGNFNEGSPNVGTNIHQTPCATFSFPSAIAYNSNPWNLISFDNSTSTGDVNNIDGGGGGGDAGGEAVL